MEDKTKNEEPLEKTPILGSWKAVYVFVMIFFVITVTLFYWFTVSYN